MIYPIYIYGSTVLRKLSSDITPDYPEFKQLVDNLFETMYSSEGVGLAAPQVGKSIRLFVVDGTPFTEGDPAMQDFKRVFVNAHIYELSEETCSYSEGCLSVPGIHEEVERSLAIRMRYHDENFVEHDEEFTGYAAWIIQHEYDHLDGKLFIDRLMPLRKTLLKSKLAAMTRGNYKADYKSKLVK